LSNSVFVWSFLCVLPQALQLNTWSEIPRPSLLYENNWRFIEQDRLGDEEQALIDELITRFGNGVFLPR
ncbi:hypothetical protein SAMN04488049_1071, partial [Tritonibacter multivorans]